MKNCEVCRNQYDKSMTIIVGDKRHVVDCFECAIHLLAPRCEFCGCTIIGHGMEAEGSFYCCAHCAKEDGHRGVSDRTESAQLAM